MQKSVNIQAVTVPNPDAMKFEITNFLLTPGAYTFAGPEEAENSPMAKKLFGFPFVRQVFIAKNFITVTRKPDGPNWEEILIDLRIIIKKHLEDGMPLFNFDNTMAPEIPDPESKLIGEMMMILEQRVLPATWHDGGEITFNRFEDGVIYVDLHGACVDCPFASRTIKAGIEKLMVEMFPEVKEVSSDMVNWEETQQEE